MGLRSIPELVRANAGRFAGKEALVDGAIRLSYTDLETEMVRVARALAARGINPGDRVAIWAPNSASWISAFLGILAAGATVVPVNTRFKGREAAFALRRAGATLLFTVSEFLGNDYIGMLRSADPDLAIQTVLLDGGSEIPGTESWSAFIASGQSVETSEVGRRIAALTPADTAYLLFTSGTTGKPKAAVLTHGQNLHYTQVMIDRFELCPEEVVYLVLPLFHMFGLSGGFLMNMAAGASVVLADVFDAESVMRVVAAERITFLPGPPTVFQDILRSDTRHEHDLTSLRKALLSAAGVPRELVERMLAEGLVEVAFSAYGLTEALVVACSKPGDPAELTAEWSGCPLPGVEVEVRAENGERAPVGEPGEILVRSAMVMQGYLDDPEATAAALDPDGWLHTGDIGVLNAQGYLKVTDRKKDMITVGGFNVYPAEVEAILSEHPGVGRIAVVSMLDERMGEVPAAFVIPRAGHVVTPEEIVAWSRSNMANYKVPRRVEIVTELPTTASMKVRKDVLRDRLRSAT